MKPEALPHTRLPVTALLALTTASFIATANESMPAGLLPRIADAFAVTPAWAGQWVTACALGSGLAAIPLTLALQGWPRRRVLQWAVAIFCVGNAVTALSSSFVLTLLARLLVGVATGVAWSLLAGYARRLAAPALQGRATALAMLGIPVALALGVPLSAWLGGLVGWRWVFGLLSAMSLLLMLWVRVKVPDFAGQPAHRRLSFAAVLQRPGVRPVLAVVMLWIMAHYTLYTYIAPFLASVGLAAAVEQALLVFGAGALLGLWLTGLLIDRWLRALMLLSLGAFALVSLGFSLNGLPAGAIAVGMLIWGMSYSGAPTLLQTALANVAGDGADVAQSMLVTVLNLAFAASGVVGGVLLQTFGAGAVAAVVPVLVVPALLIVSVAGRRGFHAHAPRIG